jgi:hypothetical protein
METATFANRKLRLAVLLYILRRKRHRSIQRKKLYFNTDVKCLEGVRMF